MERMALVSGIPGSGKSEYGRWLQRERGFIHLDLENGGMDRPELYSGWQQCVSTGLPAALVEAVDRLGAPVVLDWGFPPRFLPLVRSLHDAGVAAWWFDGDRAAARASFVRRGTVPVEALDQQMQRLDAAWPGISEFYGARVVNVVSPGGIYLPPEKISALMFGPVPTVKP
jgi:hypothetical protein